MLLGKRWLVPAPSAGAALAYARYRRRGLARVLENVYHYSAPSAAFYDSFAAPILSGFFTRVADDLVELAPRARVLEVGAGPGQLAVTLAARAPEVHVTGIDIAPDMVDRANARASRCGVTARVECLVGDVAALPFPDASFDIVVSTFSLHHWPDPAKGLAEIYRVLRPGGIARIYDVANWVRRIERRGTGAGIAELAATSPFGGEGICTQRVTAQLGPLPLVYRADLRRAQPSATSTGARWLRSRHLRDQAREGERLSPII